MNKTKAKPKRIKRVFSNPDRVLHLWANQTQSDARSKNVYFEGDTAYSYGRHYVLGRLIEYRGHRVALINSRGYSVTTARHIRSASSACAHLLRLEFNFSNVPFGTERSYIETGLTEMQGDLVSQVFDTLNQRSFWNSNKDAFSYLENSISEFNKTAKALGFSSMVLDFAAIKPLLLDHARACIARAALLRGPEGEAKREKDRLKREAIASRTAEEQVAAWRLGGQATDAVRALNPQILRIKGDEVQTSRGASVPLSEARSLLLALNNGAKLEKRTIGGFTVQAVTAESIQVNCHTLAKSEIRAVVGAV